MAFCVHLIVTDNDGPIPGSQDPRFAQPGAPLAYRVVCDRRIGLPTDACEHALTNHVPAVTCADCLAEFRRTLRQPETDTGE